MLTTTQENLKASETEIRLLLESIGVKFRGLACNCPFHDDRHPSAGIFLTEKTRFWMFKCAGCGVTGDIFDLRARINGTKLEDELKATADPRPAKPSEQPKIFPTIEALNAHFKTREATFVYADPNTGKADLLVIRYAIDGKKCFAQCSPTAGGFWMKQPPGLLPIYNRARVRNAEKVLVVEGEKCVHALHEIGIVATTSPQGAGKAHLADWSLLAGKTCILWADNDPEDANGIVKGVEHMRDVQRILLTLSPPPQVFVVNHAELELPPKGDVADFIERYATWTPAEKRSAVEAVIADAEPVGAAGEYRKEMEETILGKRRSLPFGPWERLTNATRAFIPATVTILSGEPGCGKSFQVMEAMVCWQQIGVRACVYQLEEDRNFHLKRAHAIIARNSGLTDSDWIEKNPETALRLFAAHQKDLEEIGRCIWEAPQDQVSLDMLALWVEERAKAGFEIIAIDPITAAVAEEKPWIADLKFIIRIKTIARRYGCRVLLVTHPKKMSKHGAGLNDLAGGAAYPRFAQTVVWIERNDDEKEVGIRRSLSHPQECYTPSRIWKITKARNGRGAGKRIAADFNPDSLTFDEIGLITSK